MAKANALRTVPILPVLDVPMALDHYRRLGFNVRSYDSAAEYGFAQRGGASLHLTARSSSDYPSPDAIAIAYLFVADADALYDEWVASGAGGRFDAPADMPWKVREGRHVDPDGNIIRFGQQL
jgi:hypothetical protein